MGRSDTKSLPRFESLDDLVESFDTSDWGDYLERMPEAEFQVDIGRRVHLVALDQDLVDELTQIAQARHVSFEALVNAWLRERVSADVAVLRESGSEYGDK